MERHDLVFMKPRKTKKRDEKVGGSPFVLRCVVLFLVLFLFKPWGFVEGAERMPLPEYFGVYAVDRRRLTAIFEGKGDYKPPSYQVELYSIEDQSSKTHSALQLSADVRFLVFDQEAGQLARSVKLYKLAYVQNDVQKIGAIGGWSERTQVKRINKWLAARLETLKIGLLSKPVAGQLQMVQLLPEAGLSPGLYALYYTPPTGRIYWSFFGVQFSGTPQPSECIDITLCCPMGLGGIEVTDYLMQHQPPQFPELMKDRYRACSSSQREISPRKPAREPLEGAGPTARETKLASLTRDIPDANYFRERSKVFNASFDDIWAAANRVLTSTSFLKRQQDEIVTADRDKGVLITAPTVHSRLLGSGFKRQYAISIERIGDRSTKVSVKGFCYDRKGINQWTRWERRDQCSDSFLTDLEKGLASAAGSAPEVESSQRAAEVRNGPATAPSIGHEGLSVRALGAVYKISQPYGVVDKKVNPTPGGVHAGIDFFAPLGTVVRAVRDGTVINAGGPYGTVAVFDGKNTVLYLHMNNIDMVNLGRQISVGTYLSTVDRVGPAATGVHLHIEVRKGRHAFGVGCTGKEYRNTPGKSQDPSPKGHCESARRVSDLTLDPVGYLVGTQKKGTD